MTLNAKIGVLWIFWRFRAARHISRASCVKINWDRQGEAAYESFIIERRFRRFKSRFSRFKKTCGRASKSGTPVEVAILPLLASLSWTRLQITMDMLLITKSTSDELFSRINIDDIDFCDLWLQCTLQKWTAMKWLEIDWQFANRNCYRLSCVSWA